MASSDATAIPIKNQAYRITFPILDADGDLVTGATGLDSEISKDAGTFADCTNEATEIATSSGMYYLDLTSTEMNADTVAIIVKTSSSGAKTTPIVLYPAEAGDIIVNVKQVNGTAQTARDLGANLDTTVSSRSTYSGADTSGTTTLLSRIGSSLTITGGKVDVNDKTGFRLSATGVDDIWDEVQSGHTTSGTFGKYLDQQVSTISGGGGGSSPTAAQIADAVWDERIDDHLSDRSFGSKIGIHLPYVGPDFDYKKIKGMVDEITKKIEALPKPETFDPFPISEGLQAVITEIRSLPKPKDPEKIDYSPILKRIDSVSKLIQSIEIPEPEKVDLSPILEGMDTRKEETASLISEVNGILEKIRGFFSKDVEDIKTEVESIRKELKKIPMLVMSPQPQETEGKKSVLDEYLNS